MKLYQGPTRIICHRLVDLFAATIGLLLLWPFILVAVVLASFSTKEWPIFRQIRVGKNGKRFQIAKVRTMRSTEHRSTVTTTEDPRITQAGALLRKLKLDELPQLWNVLKGDMGLVGPRPDVPGYADELDGRGEQLLSVRPGITGPATLLFRDEESILTLARDAEEVNQEIIYPTKTAVNLAWLNNATLLDDLSLVWMTAAGATPQRILGLVEQWEPGLTSEPPISLFLDWINSQDDEQLPASRFETPQSESIAPG